MGPLDQPHHPLLRVSLVLQLIEPPKTGRYLEARRVVLTLKFLNPLAQPVHAFAQLVEARALIRDPPPAPGQHLVETGRAAEIFEKSVHAAAPRSIGAATLPTKQRSEGVSINCRATATTSSGAISRRQRLS